MSYLGNTVVSNESEFPSDFTALKTALQQGCDRKLHTAVQVYASVNNTPVLDLSYGDASPHVALASDASMLWRSAGKPLTALLVLQRIEQGKFTLDSTLDQLLPQRSSADMAEISVKQLLTHTSAIPTVDTGWPTADWATSVCDILQATLQLPIGTAAYHPQSSWFLLGEILLKTADNAPAGFQQLIRSELLKPLQLDGTSCGLEHANEQILPQIPTLYERQQGELIESSYNSAAHRMQPSPGGGLRGPVRELGRFYELLLNGGQTTDGIQIVSGESVASMISRHRVGEYDQTLQHIVDFGLGLIVNSNRYGAETVPYGFGRFASDDAFGHGGSQCAMGFCDPQHKLVVAWAANGFCGEGQHQRRNRMINEAIYHDLGLAR